IQPMSFTYFDPSAGRYKTLTSKEIVLRVIDGPGLAQNQSAASGVQKQQVQASEQFQFIKLKTELKSANRKDFFGSTSFYTLLLLPMLAIPAVVLIRRKKHAADSDIMGNRARRSDRLARKYLSEAKRQFANKE